MHLGLAIPSAPGQSAVPDAAFALDARIAEFRYQRGARPALGAVDLKVRPGEFVVIVGSAGAGKTTLCYCLTGVVPHFIAGAYQGTVKINGQDLAELPLPRIAALAGFVLQRPENQLFNVTVAEDVAFGPENLGWAPERIRLSVERSLAFVGMSGAAQRLSASLSGGETQRVALSCVLALEPGLFILDQPAAEFDPLGRKRVYEHLRRLNVEAGKTIVLVEDRLTEVVSFASRLICLHEGRIVRDAAPAEFFADEQAFSQNIRLPDSINLHYHLQGYLPAVICPPTVSAPREMADRVRPFLDPARLARLADAGTDGGARPDHQAAPTVLEVRDLGFRYPGSERWALRGLNLGFEQGEFTAIIGENGAGKTTLAKNLAGLLRPTRGQVFVAGKDSARISTARLSDTLGYSFQDPDCQIFCDSVFDEVAFGMRVRKVPTRETAEAVDDTLRSLGLLALKHRHPYTLSRQQRRRLALASILIYRPRVLLVDEPAAGLDQQATTEIMGLLTEFNHAGGTVLMITHDMDAVVGYTKRSIVLAAGKVQLDAATSSLGDHLEVLSGAGIELPDFFLFAHALGLPRQCRDVAELTNAITQSLY
ncbi:MAG: ABC transporter ATP-binding protein [Chloroflexota bacterium]